MPTCLVSPFLSSSPVFVGDIGVCFPLSRRNRSSSLSYSVRRVREIIPHSKHDNFILGSSNFPFYRRSLLIFFARVCKMCLGRRLASCQSPDSRRQKTRQEKNKYKFCKLVAGEFYSSHPVVFYLRPLCASGFHTELFYVILKSRC